MVQHVSPATGHGALPRPNGPTAVLIMGTGAIGAYIGGTLAAAGVPVRFVGRPRVLHDLSAHGLTLTSLDGQHAHLPPSALQLFDEPAAAASGTPPLVLLCVKGGATAQAADELNTALPEGTLVVSMQNGLHNASVAQGAAPRLRVVAGMVPYNVAQVGPGRFHRGSSGALAAQAVPELQAWLPVFHQAGLPLKLHANMPAVQWAKLLLNLNNPVNALSGQPLQAQLLQRDYRRVTAALMSEALGVMRAAGIRPARLTPLPAAWVPGLLRLPTPLFERLAKKLLRIDPHARSSMADDLARSQPTEIRLLCGEITALAQRLGCTAPRNAAMVKLIEAWPQSPRPWPANELLAAIEDAPS